jgi:hypothetical protein
MEIVICHASLGENVDTIFIRLQDRLLMFAKQTDHTHQDGQKQIRSEFLFRTPAVCGTG